MAGEKKNKQSNMYLPHYQQLLRTPLLTRKSTKFTKYPVLKNMLIIPILSHVETLIQEISGLILTSTTSLISCIKRGP